VVWVASPRGSKQESISGDAFEAQVNVDRQKLIMIAGASATAEGSTARNRRNQFLSIDLFRI
jgi:hypothetical protein